MTRTPTYVGLVALPLPGSMAICYGSPALVPPGATTDQRGFPRLNTSYTGYGVAHPCLDAGAIQTNYQGVEFSSASYAGIANGPVSPAPVVSVIENGQVSERLLRATKVPISRACR